MFNGLFDTSTTTLISLNDFMICLFTSLLIGLFLTWTYMYKTRYTKSFVATLAMLPAIVCVVIMMVNGNVGTGVAVAGAFSLVRFRSAPGTAKEIGAIFLAMGTGLVVGMGYIAYAVLIAFILGIISLIYASLDFGNKRQKRLYKTMHITIPEGLDYTGVFDDLFMKYTREHDLTMVKTTNMGSLFKLTYNMTLKDEKLEKIFIDELRCRNGNLEISISNQVINEGEL